MQLFLLDHFPFTTIVSKVNERDYIAHSEMQKETISF